MEITIALRGTRITRWLAWGLIFLVAMHLIGVFCHFVLGIRAAAWVRLFDMDLETNLPSFYNCFLFFVCAALFFFHARIAPLEHRRGWMLMAFVFVFLGIDEGTQIHEKFISFTQRLLLPGQGKGTDIGLLYHAWVIPYALASIVLGLFLFRWLKSLDRRLLKGFVFSGMVYLIGAVGMEMVGGMIAAGLTPDGFSPDQMLWVPCDVYGIPGCFVYASIKYVAAYTVEETLEMTGLILCAGVLLRSLESNKVKIGVDLGPHPDTRTAVIPGISSGQDKESASS